MRALESQAVERAIIRVLESDAAQDALERTLASPAVERAAVSVLDSELVDHVWDRLLASDEAQKLVERIAEAPEMRAAIASQGVGLIEDIGREIRDDRRPRRRGHRPGRRGACAGCRERTEPATHGRAGHPGGRGRRSTAPPQPRSSSASRRSSGITIGGVLGDDSGPSGWRSPLGAALWIGAGALYLGVFWSLAGQTPGMRFLSIRLDADGERRIGARRAFAA